MKWQDIIGFMKNGKNWADIKAAQEFFESKDDLDAFLASGWSIDDIKEAKEMCETNPVAQKVDKDHFEKATPKEANEPAEIGGAFAKLAKE